MEKFQQLIDFIKSNIEPDIVSAEKLTSHRYYLPDGSGFWDCKEDNDYSVFGKQESLMYKLMDIINMPLKNQGTEIYHRVVKKLS